MTSELPRTLTSILACPISRQPLDLVQLGGESKLSTKSGSHVYLFRSGVPSLIPEKIPQALSEKWQIWEALQQNGLIAYSALPSANTSQDEEDAQQAVEAFDLSGLVLDVGCGPCRERSAYASGIDPSNYVGLDPLLGEQPRDFTFIHGIAEYLPFTDASFDSVILYSSLDHVLDLEMALSESARVLKPGGHVNIWMDKMPSKQHALFRTWDILRRGIRQLISATGELGVIKGISYTVRLARMKIPKGASDPFHFKFPSPDEVITSLQNKGFGNIRQKDLGSEIAFSLRKTS